MPLSWNEIRDRALAFSRDWADAHAEDAEAKSFLDGFFNVFGVSRRRLASFETRVVRSDGRDGYIDLLWKGRLLVEPERMGRLHDKLLASGYGGHDLEVYLVRLLFGLFAEDTGIFEVDQFQGLILERTAEDGSDLAHWLGPLFEVLNTPPDQRLTRLDAQLAAFPYVNGQLYAERLPTAVFDRETRELLLECCALDWGAISPAIFGALFQSAMQAGARRQSGAHYTSEAERDQLLADEPAAAAYLRPYLGADGFINDRLRYCLWLKDCPLQALRSLPRVLARVDAVRRMRAASSKAATREKANAPTLFTEDRQPESGHYLALPRTSSEHRRYLPIGYLDCRVIASNDLQIVPDARPFQFGILSSAMHMAWMRITSGRLESRYRYSVKYTYNTFPWPDPTDKQRQKIETAAQAVLEARAQHPKATLAALYDPTMPPALVRAHRQLDAAVDAAYARTAFAGDRDRAALLFARYRALTEIMDRRR